LEPGKFETVRWTEPVPPAAEATIRRSCIVLGFAPVAVLGSSRAAVQVTCLRRAVAPIVYGARTILVTDLDYLPDLGIVGRERFEGKYASFVDGKTEIMSTWEQSETKSFSGP
jgi:hypothetical protein